MNIERRVKEIFNWQAKKEREYKEIASAIIDAIEAKRNESDASRFRIPWESRALKTGGEARCGVATSMAGSRTAYVIEEEPFGYFRGERAITIIGENPYDVYPFIQYHEEITKPGQISVTTDIADPDSARDLRPKMWDYLRDVKNWEPVT